MNESKERMIEKIAVKSNIWLGAYLFDLSTNRERPAFSDSDHHGSPWCFLV
jgi:hypothetical protein